MHVFYKVFKIIINTHLSLITTYSFFFSFLKEVWEGFFFPLMQCAALLYSLGNVQRFCKPESVKGSSKQIVK